MFCVMGLSDLSILVIKLYIALHELTLAVANMWLALHLSLSVQMSCYKQRQIAENFYS